jgi:hypothetical protein
MYEREEIMYKQRSRQEWLKAGDQNTRFFRIEHLTGDARTLSNSLGERTDLGVIQMRA